MNANLEAAARALQQARCAIAVTGAGMSAESGIPTFRGEDGIWEKYPPDEFASIDAYRANPEKVWQFWRELAELVRGCKPNAGHIALAELERVGRVQAVITQNVDNLHQAAGSERVIEYHGNARRLVCLRCHARRSLSLEDLRNSGPHCALCNGLAKPDVVMFGEDIPQHAMFEAHAFAERCDCMLVIGTSAQVYPAARLPLTAKAAGAVIIEINIEQTDFTGTVTDLFLQGPAGSVLPDLVSLLPASS